MSIPVELLARLSDQVYSNWRGGNPGATFSDQSQIVTSYTTQPRYEGTAFDGWSKFDDVRNEKFSYYAEAWRNSTTGEIIVVNRGTGKIGVRLQLNPECQSWPTDQNQRP